MHTSGRPASQHVPIRRWLLTFFEVAWGNQSSMSLKVFSILLVEPTQLMMCISKEHHIFQCCSYLSDTESLLSSVLTLGCPNCMGALASFLEEGIVTNFLVSTGSKPTCSARAENLSLVLCALPCRPPPRGATSGLYEKTSIWRKVLLKPRSSNQNHEKTQDL